MNTETAPDSCPFCGAGMNFKHGKPVRSSDGSVAGYVCGNRYDAVSWDGAPRLSQTKRCSVLERERLTRERDEAMAKVQWFIDEWDAAQVAANFDPIPFVDRSALLVTIDDVKEREASNWQARVKQLETERDEARAERDDSRDAFKRANEAYAKAVSASLDTLETIQGLQARVKRLEEAGEAVFQMAALHVPAVTQFEFMDEINEWRKAKESKR